MKLRGPLVRLIMVLAFAGLVSAPMPWASFGRSIVDRAAPAASDCAAVAEARVRLPLERDLSKLGLHHGAPVFMRIFKREKMLELWVEHGRKQFELFRSYPICTYSGELGPKLREGDNQAPEGFYRVATGQLNPNSRFHLSFNLGYPNAYDRAHGRTGDFLMVHGSCVSIGCYAMGDDAIEEIYSMAAAALREGQSAFDVHVFPFRLGDASLEAQLDSPWHAFWSELRPAHDLFEATHRVPRVRVDGLHYRVDAN